MFPNTVIFHYGNEIFEVHQKSMLRADFMIFDELDLLNQSYNGKAIKRLYVIDRNLTKEVRDFITTTIVNADTDTLQKKLLVLRQLNIEYGVIVEGGKVFYETINFSSHKDNRPGEPKTILALEVGNAYTIRQLLANALEYNLRRGLTFSEAIKKLEEAGLFGDCIIHYRNLVE